MRWFAQTHQEQHGWLLHNSTSRNEQGFAGPGGGGGDDGPEKALGISVAGMQYAKRGRRKKIANLEMDRNPGIDSSNVWRLYRLDNLNRSQTLSPVQSPLGSDNDQKKKKNEFSELLFFLSKKRFDRRLHRWHGGSGFGQAGRVHLGLLRSQGTEEADPQM